jgi:hypothetical protein
VDRGEMRHGFDGNMKTRATNRFTAGFQYVGRMARRSPQAAR